VEIVPNPFGGVNTHLWRNEAYIVGIVPVVRPAYSLEKKGVEQEQEGRGLLACWVQCFDVNHGVLSPQNILNHHETEDGEISFTEEARGDTDRMGVANDR
jgi:hypothetical protein